MDDLNKGHPTSNLDNWALNYLRGMGEMGSSLTGVLTECQCIAWASHYWSGYVFTASSLSDWLFALEYNSLSVSHILPQETCALITTRPCYYWKGTTDSPRGQPCANDHTTFFYARTYRRSEQNIQLPSAKRWRIIRPHMCSTASDHEIFHSTIHSYLCPQGLKIFFRPPYRTRLLSGDQIICPRCNTGHMVKGRS